MARGHVYQRNGRWYLRISAGINPATGERWQPSGGGHGTRREAEQTLARLLHEIDTGAYVAPVQDSFAAYAHYWLDTLAPATIRPQTLVNYRQTITLHILPTLGRHRLQDIRSGHIQALDRALAGKISPGYRRNAHSRLRQIFAAAMREKLIVVNPMDGVPRPKAPRVGKRGGAAGMQVWTHAQLLTALSLLRADEHAVLWRVYAMTGLRAAEALGLRWADVDVQASALHCRQQVVYTRHDGEHWTLEVTPILKSENSYRSIAVDPETQRMLAAHRAAQAARRLQIGSLWQDYDLVFPRADGQPDAPHNIGARWRTRARRMAAQVPVIRLHDLRHTHATHLLQGGENVRMVADRLGHDTATLLRTYAHVLPGAQKDAVRRLMATLERADAQDAAGAN